MLDKMPDNIEVILNVGDQMAESFRGSSVCIGDNVVILNFNEFKAR